jgi:hypothetical protein
MMSSTLRISSRLLVVATALLALAGLGASAAWAAEGERVFDPTLSLVGGCIEETFDPVEDPGCPSTPPAGNHPPAGFFAKPNAVGTDFQGNIYVASKGKKSDGTEGRIDIFSPEGAFITEIAPVTAPGSLVIDSNGVLYVYSESGELLRFEPCGAYDPANSQIEYCNPPVVVNLSGRGGNFVVGLALDRQNNHLYINFGGSFVEYGSAEEGNEEVRATTVQGSGTGFVSGMAVDAAHQRLYVQEDTDNIGVYDLAEGLLPGEEFSKIDTIEAGSSGVPGGHFGGLPSLAVDEGTGNIFVFDTENAHLWELDEEGDYLATIDFPFVGNGAYGLQIAVDNGLTSPNGKLSEEEDKGRYLYVPYPAKGTGHSLAFFVATVGAPEVTSIAAGSIGEDEAALQARIDPNNLQTTYTFQIKSEGAAEWTTVEGGTLPAGNLAAEVSTAAAGLSPGTHYLFRVLATNEEGSDEAEGSFATYPSLPAETSPCSNTLLRSGLSGLLPDCRAYELVTPPDTNARTPLGAETEGGAFPTRQVSPAGDKLPFRVVGGALPGLGGTGGLKGDPYLATRTATGWSTASAGPSGAEAVAIAIGANSPDQGYSFWEVAVEGSAALGPVTSYVRYPDGHSELTGQGSLGIDPEVGGRLISEGGGHIVFATGVHASSSSGAIQLEPNAAPDGTQAIYDRTPDGTTHVISLKPGDVPFGAGENAEYEGASLDGIGIAFKVDNVLYLRYDDKETFEIGEGIEFAGVAEGGGRVFYLENGNLEAFDVASESVIEFADTVATVVPATISADGSTAYFISKSAVQGLSPNPKGAKPHVGGQNLYRSREGQISFVGTVTERDVVGSADKTDGLSLWVRAIGPPSPVGRLGWVPARSTPDGSVFLFKSRAALTAYDPEGHAEIYRYDSVMNDLRCLSCNPTGAPARSDANLQSEGSDLFAPIAWPENLRADGRRAFFESSEPLVARDTDGLQDVYEWEDQGVGSCTQPEGCIYLISSPQSRRDEYLWAVSRSGDDVFFRSSDLLVGTDVDETPSIYDARVNGGFAEPASAECEGEGCRPHLTPPPLLPLGETPVRGSGDNVKPRHCGKGKRKVKRHGKVRCVRKKRHQHHARRAGAGQKGGRR